MVHKLPLLLPINKYPLFSHCLFFDNRFIMYTYTTAPPPPSQFRVLFTQQCSIACLDRTLFLKRIISWTFATISCSYLHTPSAIDERRYLIELFSGPCQKSFQMDGLRNERVDRQTQDNWKIMKLNRTQRYVSQSCHDLFQRKTQ